MLVRLFRTPKMRASLVLLCFRVSGCQTYQGSGRGRPFLLRVSRHRERRYCEGVGGKTEYDLGLITLILYGIYDGAIEITFSVF